MIEHIVIVLCEGQTEQGFVEKVLNPYLVSKGMTSVKSVLVTTNKLLNATGGLQTYKQVKKDLKLIKYSNANGESVKYIITTMFDLYALPKNFPGYKKASQIVDKYKKVEHLEKAFAEDVDDIRFVPYIQLHEFEALVFCGLPYLKDMYPGCVNGYKQLEIALKHQPNPELINNNPRTAPSKRIIKAIESSYNYNKPKAGKYVTEKVGIDELRKRCNHFNQWIEKLLKQ